MDFRIKRNDTIGLGKQILSLGGGALVMAPLEFRNKIAKVTNEGYARIVEEYPDRFYGAGVVSLHDVGAATDELERCVKDLGLLGVQILSNADGRPLDLPEFEPFYARAEKLGAGLWIHPAHVKKLYPWSEEYDLDYVLGWGFDESVAVFRLARGGVLERHPNLKIITHHMGVMIPFYGPRIQKSIMREGKDGKPPEPLKRDPIDYLKMFYVDTAEGSSKPAMVCAQLFYGASHMLFATDFPYGGGIPDPEWPLQIIKIINELDITEEEKEMIFRENVAKLFKL